MSSVKRWAEQNGLLEPRSQQEQDWYWDGDEKIGYRTNDDAFFRDLFSSDEQQPETKVKIEVEMPRADLEALERFLLGVDAKKVSPEDPYEASRLEGALDELTDAVSAALEVPSAQP